MTSLRQVGCACLQDIALLDARRGVTMFQQINVPILGLVENMSFYACPNCGHQAHIFGRDGVVRTAQELGVDVIGQVQPDSSPCVLSGSLPKRLPS